MIRTRLAFIAFLPLALLAGGACAQTMTQSFTLQNGQLVGGAAPSSPGGSPASSALALSDEQKMMFEAPKYVFNRDYASAENLYSRVLAMDPGNVEAYIQRGLVRREMGNAQGVISDGRNAVIMANNTLKGDPNNATLYYQRSMGFRLLKQFDQARKDVQTAIRLSGSSNWDTDLKAIDLEQKIAQSQP